MTDSTAKLSRPCAKLQGGAQIAPRHLIGGAAKALVSLAIHLIQPRLHTCLNYSPLHPSRLITKHVPCSPNIVQVKDGNASKGLLPAIVSQRMPAPLFGANVLGKFRCSSLSRYRSIEQKAFPILILQSIPILQMPTTAPFQMHQIPGLKSA